MVQAEVEAGSHWEERAYPFSRVVSLGVLAALPVMLPFLFLYLLIWRKVDLVIRWESYRLFLLAFVAGIVVHELLHGVSYVVLGRRSWREVRFGFDRRTLSPFAHLGGPVPARIYRISCVMPLVVLGIVPGVVALLTGKVGVLLFGLLFILGAGGDLLILWSIRDLGAEVLVRDHPSAVGCWVQRG